MDTFFELTCFSLNGAQLGAKWMPVDRHEINDARRSFLK